MTDGVDVTVEGPADAAWDAEQRRTRTIEALQALGFEREGDDMVDQGNGVGFDVADLDSINVVTELLRIGRHRQELEFAVRQAEAAETVTGMDALSLRLKDEQEARLAATRMRSAVALCCGVVTVLALSVVYLNSTKFGASDIGLSVTLVVLSVIAWVCGQAAMHVGEAFKDAR